MNLTEIDPEGYLTSHQVGALLKVDPSSVNNWVKAGRLSAFRTPGGHLRVRVSDLVVFLNVYRMPIPERLVTAAHKRLMVVDDDPRQLRALRRLLKPHDAQLEVLLLDNEIDALIQVGAFRPHLIVLDVYMGDLDGVEVARRLKANPATRGIDIIITSAHMTEELERRAQKVGAVSCIAKPLSVSQILDALGVATQPLGRKH
ncbi:MAG: response regulator [Deltaproteobacteria bacterium]|nr:response regulator [Deltaproteobacteria bacterium]